MHRQCVISSREKSFSYCNVRAWKNVSRIRCSPNVAFPLAYPRSYMRAMVCGGTSNLFTAADEEYSCAHFPSIYIMAPDGDALLISRAPIYIGKIRACSLLLLLLSNTHVKI